MSFDTLKFQDRNYMPNKMELKETMMIEDKMEGMNLVRFGPF